MPIIGLTDNQSSELGLNLVKIGSLRKGEEGEIKKNKYGKEYKSFGKDLTYFRIAFEPEYDHLFPVWQSMYGHQPDTFDNVFIAQGTVEKAFATWKEEYSTIGLLHRCDGEHQVRSYVNAGEDKGHWTDAKLPCAMSCECRNVGRLNLIFPEFIDETGAFGFIAVTTHSIHDIITIHRYLSDMFKLRQRTGHDLTGVPFTFGRRSKEITSPIVEDGKRTGGRRKNVKSLLFIKADEEFTKTVLLPSLTMPLLSQPVTTQAALPQPKELRLADGLKTATNERRIGFTSTEGAGKKIELGEDGKLVIISDTPEEAKPEETPTPVVIESTATVVEPTPEPTNVITIPEGKKRIDAKLKTLAKVEPTANNGKKYVFQTEGGNSVSCFGRELFRTANYDVEWWATGDKFEPMIEVVVEENVTDKGTYYNIVSVAPNPSPAVDMPAASGQ